MPITLRNTCVIGRLFFIFFLGNVLLPSTKSSAQDALFSQYFAFKNILNPALAGFEDGTSFQTQYRRQWFVLDGGAQSFVLQGAAANFSVPAIQSGFSLSYLNSQMGEGALNWNQVALSYAWRTRSCNQVFSERDWELSLGSTVSYNSYNFQDNNFIFSDQLELFSNSLNASQYQFRGDLQGLNPYVDISAGALFNWEYGHNAVTIGVATHHFVRVENSLFGRDDTLSPRFTVHASHVFNRVFGGTNDQNIQIIALAKLDMQAASWPADGNWSRLIDMGLMFNLRNLPGVYGGALFRIANLAELTEQTNAIVLVGGVELGNAIKLDRADYLTRIGFSWDINPSGLRSDGGGTFEISLSLNLPQFSLMGCNSRFKMKNQCPKF
ncbi:MAG: PorP/SprF family type IX secretion system membrane protein [Bacteroidota bacterium]